MFLRRTPIINFIGMNLIDGNLGLFERKTTSDGVKRRPACQSCKQKEYKEISMGS